MSDLITTYQERLNLHDATFSRIEHEDAIVAIVYRVTRSDGTEQILKICSQPRHYSRELYFLNYFADKLPVPFIVDTVPPETNLKGALLMECLPGAIIGKGDLTPDLAFEMGSLLARIHLNRVEIYGDLTLSRPNLPSSDPRAPFAFKFQEALDECRPHLPKDLLAQCQRYLDEHLFLFDSVDGPCIVHRDFRPGNIIALDGKIQGIIDWSAAQAGFTEEDFCTLEHGEWAQARAIKKAFFAGYSLIRPVPAYERIMPLLRLNKALTFVGFTLRTNTWKNTNARFYETNRQYIETFFGDL